MTTAPAGPRTGPSFHETAYRVRFDEAGPDGVLRTSGLMRYAQDLAWLHSTALGFGREWYAARGLTWLVRAAELAVLAGAPMGTDVRARTQVVGMRRVFARRRGTFHLADGTLAAWVHTDWVLIDDRGALTRIPPIFREMFGASDAAGSVGRVPLPPTPEDATRQSLTVRPHELDPMAHANNAVYLDWMEEAIAAAWRCRGGRRHSPPLSSRVRARRGRRRRAGIGGLAVRPGLELPAHGAVGRHGHLPGDAPSRGSRSDHRGGRMTRIVLHGGRVFDGSGADPSPGDVAIEDGRIVDLGTGLDGDQAVDVTGKTILPGLFDCHTHVCISNVDLWGVVQEPFSIQFYEAQANLRKTLEIGITSVRDAGGADLGIRTALERGMIVGPRMQISIAMLSQTGGHGDDWYPSGGVVPLMVSHPGRPPAIVDGPDAVRQKVRELHRMGADVIKVATSGGVLSPRDDPRHAHFRPAELEALVEEATAAGIFVMAHAQGADGIKNAVRAGIRSIEHGIFLDDEGIELMLRHGTWLVPTLVAPQGVLDAVAAGVSLPPAIVDKARLTLDIHRAAFRTAVEAGVRIAMGTDSGVTPHGENLRELELMAAGGMTPAAVLEATTRSAAQLLGVDGEVGTIEPGKRADLVVLDGDPYDFAGMRERIDQVWQDGGRVA